MVTERQLVSVSRDVLFGDAAEGSCGVRQNSVADLAGLFAGYVGTRTVSMAADRLVARIKCRTREFCKSGWRPSRGARRIFRLAS